MDPQTFLDVATVVTKLKMYPYFDVAHYVLCCLAVRDDIVSQAQTAAGQALTFQRKHPLSSWLSSMLVCFAGSIVANFLLGEPILTPFKDQRDLATASIIWYMINYCPFDLVYKLAKLLPFKLLICMLKEVQRAHKVYHGVVHTAKLYPSAYVVIVVIGIVKGNGSGLIKNFERLVRGIWIPGSNELLQPTFVTKECLVASIIFLLERLGYIAVPHPLIYFGVVIFFVYFKISSLLLGIVDPFVPLENLFCAIFMGGMWDAMRRAVKTEPVKEEDKDGLLRNDVIKSKEEKKKE
ncbi:trimeric intracellular cation channel type 1B.1-like [Pomacea canaliculata]|uniref:trimeric intracellular cation channel type 1B.1-like n=1 Tax=Pomacea canaliculata TaxID=400727 RepID=UPI000D72E66B|nr:trimeric intracellular cation channel type 1B.1-like [Pomacea canaliculata]